MPDLVLPIAAESLLGRDLFIPLGGVAATLATLGMLLLLPIYITQRREVKRLVRWMEREPDAGTREFAAITAEQLAAAGLTPSGTSAAAERVTSERPALARVGTAEHAAALKRMPLWRRALERGPRHPLVISIVALLIAAAIVLGVGSLLRPGENEGDGRGIAPSEIEVVILNASSSSGLAAQIADSLAADDFAVQGTTALSEPINKSVVKYAPGARRQARIVANQFGATRIGKFNRTDEANADGASVLVIAGEDAARAQEGPG